MTLLNYQSQYLDYLDGFRRIIYGDLDPKLGIMMAEIDVIGDLTSQNPIPVVQIMMTSVRYEVVMTLARLFDRSNAAERSIFKFLNYCESHRPQITWIKGQLTQEMIDQQRDSLQSFENTIGRIKLWRDKSLAHYDKEFFNTAGTLSKEHPIEFEELVGITRVLQEILGKHTFGVEQSATISASSFAYAALRQLYEKHGIY